MNKKLLLVMLLFALLNASVCESSSDPVTEMFGKIINEGLNAQSLILSAELGDVKAQREVAVRLYNNKKYPEAFKYAKMAAEQGDAYSQYIVGFMYRHGQGIEQNDLEAYEWLQKSASQGDINGIYELACLCEDDFSEEESFSRAYFHTAAYKGHAQALKRLGIENFYQANTLAKEFCENEYRFKRLYVDKNIIVRGKVSSIESDSNNNPVVIIEEYGPTLTFIKCSVSPEDPDIYNVKKNNFATIEGKVTEAESYSIKIKNGVIKSAD